MPEYVHPITAKGPTYVGSKLVYQGEAVQSDVPINYVDPPAIATLDADGLPPDVSVATWAALQAIPVGRRVVGRRYGVRQPVCTNGTHGTIWVWTGTMFRPAGGSPQNLFLQDSMVVGAGPTTALQIFRSMQFEPGVLAGCRRIFIRAGFDRSVLEANPGAGRIYIGATGTSADQILSATAFTTSDFSLNMMARFAVLSANQAAYRPFAPNNNSAIDTITGTTIARAANVALAASLELPLFVTAAYLQAASPTATISNAYLQIEVQ